MVVEPLNYQKIEDGIRGCLNRQEILTGDYATTGDNLANAETDYKIGIAKARLEFRYENSAIKVTDQRTDDEATKATEELRLEYELAKSKHESTKQALYTCRERLNALRSLIMAYREAGG